MLGLHAEKLISVAEPGSARVTLIENFKPPTENRSVMHEYILSRILGDEAEAFFIVPPFYFAAGHSLSPDRLSAPHQKAKDTTPLVHVCPESRLLTLHMLQ